MQHYIGQNLLGVALLDRFSYFTAEFLKSKKSFKNVSIQDLIDSYKGKDIKSTVTVRKFNVSRSLSNVYILILN